MSAVVTKIVEWVNETGKPVWWKHAIRLTLSKGQLSDEELDLVCKVSQMESDFIEKTDLFGAYSLPVSAAGFESEEKSVTLKSIGPVKNVAALAENQVLPFEEKGITVIYGDNGVGKSSYARILKNTCLARGNIEEIKGNVFLDDHELPSAVITLLDGADEINLTWIKGGAELTELKSIRIFDTQSSLHYVAKEGVIEYKPIGIHLLDELIRACGYVKQQAEAASEKYKKPTVLPVISSETNIGGFVARINSQTDQKLIEGELITEQQLELLPTIQQKIFNLKSKTAEQLRGEVRRKYERIYPLLTHINKCVEALSDNVLDKIIGFQTDYNEKLSALDALRKDTFSEENITAQGSLAWTDMFTAVDQYLKTIDKSLPLSAEDDCPFCLQSLDAGIAGTLKGFHEYIHNELAQQVNNARQVVESAKKPISKLITSVDPYKALLGELDESIEGCKDKVDNLISSLNERKKNLCSEVVEQDELIIIKTLVTTLEEYVEKLKLDEKSFSSDEDIEKEISLLDTQILELTNKKLFSEHKDSYLREIKRRSKSEKISTIINSTNSRKVTQLSTEINQEAVITSLQEKFLDELKLLGFKNYKVEAATRGARGSQLLKIKISDLDISPSDIASEGEQKCLALASFLAEISADGRKSAIVLDDPVNSLAHRWRGKFAKRIVLESKQRQVIVFSHDLPFIKMLEEEAKGDLVIKALDRMGASTGHVLEVPHWDTMNTKMRVGTLKQDLVQLKKSSETESEQDYHEKVKIFYSKKRGTWERLIEELLLKKVIERFSRSVSTLSLRYLVDITEEDIKIIDKAMSKCSQVFDGHDTASAIGLEFIPFEDVEKDFTVLDKYFKAVKKRRNG